MTIQRMKNFKEGDQVRFSISFWMMDPDAEIVGTGKIDYIDVDDDYEEYVANIIVETIEKHSESDDPLVIGDWVTAQEDELELL